MRPFFYRRGSAACQQQLLEDKVHLTAGATVVAALSQYEEKSQAASSSQRADAPGNLSQAALQESMTDCCALVSTAFQLLVALKQVGALSEGIHVWIVFECLCHVVPVKLCFLCWF